MFTKFFKTLKQLFVAVLSFLALAIAASLFGYVGFSAVLTALFLCYIWYKENQNSKITKDFIITDLNKQYENWVNEFSSFDNTAQTNGTENNIKRRNRMFVIDFAGDVAATSNVFLAKEIDLILQICDADDQVFLRLESPGGYLIDYGLASSQLMRVRDRKINLVIGVDRMAASGGYMMAVTANKIICAPFALVGSVGVVGEVFNVNKALKEKGIEVESFAAGKSKRTLTTFGENDDLKREEFKKDLQDTHKLFIEHVRKFRSQLDMDVISSGKAWYGQQAKDLLLVDEMKTTSDYLLEQHLSGKYRLLSVRHRRPVREPSFMDFFKIR